MIELLAAVFVASLVGSLHCAGMCGGIVVLCVGGEAVRPGPDRGRDRGRAWKRHAAYNLGRLVAYVSLGAMSGAVGAAVDLGGARMGLPRVTAIVSGAAMILFGLVALLRASGVRGPGLRLPPRLQGALEAGMGAARRLPPVRRALAVGLLTALLPCGWLYAFVVAAAATGSAPLGALTMAVFWLGTVPILLGLGAGVETLARPLRRRLPTVTAIALVAVGAAAVIGRLNVPAYAEAAGPAETPLEVIEAGPPCCHDDP